MSRQLNKHDIFVSYLKSVSSSHFVPQVSKTCIPLCTSNLDQRSTDPNKPPRKAELFWALLPQLFAQLFTQSESELFELLNTQSETAGYFNKITVATDLNLQPLPVF